MIYFPINIWSALMNIIIGVISIFDLVFGIP